MTLEEIAENHGLTPEGVDYALTQYQIVICEITQGMLSKLSYDAKDIIRIAQDRWCETCDLKEQEPKQVIGIADSIEGMEVGYCPSCDRAIVNKKIDETKFCKFCGQAVKWDD